ncbi:MAG: DUF2252 domain-containing protein [Actinomycetes bacterium]
MEEKAGTRVAPQVDLPHQPRRRRPAPAYVPVEQRAERGRAARRDVPRSSHEVFTAWAATRDPVDILERQAGSRVPELVPIRYGRMMASPFSFFRGAALLMAGDLVDTPRTGFTVQLCGDAHLSNFGLYASPERRLVFDVNDFDETLPGPWEWDVKRLAASLAVAGRDNGFSRGDCRDVVASAMGRYREVMRELAQMRNLDVWYARVDAADIEARVSGMATKAQRKRLDATLGKARRHDNVQAFDKLTGLVDGERRIRSDPPVLVPIGELLPDPERQLVTTSLFDLVRRYGRSLASDRRALLEQFHPVDIARKVVGVGSVGTRAWIILMLGRDGEDPLFLQAKEAQPSVLSEFLGKSAYTNEGHRVVAGQRIMQASSDILLGWERVTGIDGQERDFYVRQLRDGKGSAVVEAMDPDALRVYGALCGGTLARAHARSGDRIAIAAYLGTGNTFDQALARFAEAYADQNARDHEAFVRAVRTGRVTALEGV